MIFLVENKVIQNFIDSFCMMLLHSLWQGLLFAIMGGALLYLRSTASFKYNTLLILCLLFFGTCSLTFWWNYHYSSSLLIVLKPEVISSYNILNLFIEKSLSFTTTHAKFIFMLWLLCVAFCMVKMFINFLYFNNVKHTRIIETPRIWFEQVDRLRQKLGIKSVVHIKESAKVKVPIVLGHFKPVILFPLGLLAKLPAEQVEAILLHELAHIRRNDYLINLFQNIAEALFFFNPGFLLLSGWLRSQREHCCDDIALSYTPNVKTYLLALVDFKGYVSKNNYRLAFTGNNVLFNRVSRILGKPYRKISSREISILGVSLIGLIGWCNLHLKSQHILTSKQEKIADNVVKKIEQSVIDLNFQIQPPFKKDHDPLNTRPIAMYTKVMPIRKPRVPVIIVAPMIINVKGANGPPASSEQDPESYQTAIEEYKNNMALYNKDMVQYNSDRTQYNKEMVQYNSGMAQYNKEMAQYNSEMQVYNNSMKKYNLEMEEYNNKQSPRKDNSPK